MSGQLDIPLLLAVAAAAVVSFLATFGVRRWALAYDLIDVPDDRRWHPVPTPRAGGVAIFAGMFVGLAIALRMLDLPWSRELIVYLAGATLIAAIGLLDDIYTLSKRLRFAVQGIVALLCIGGGISVSFLELPYFQRVELGVLGPFLTWLWIVGFVNLYNFMDGIDGMATMQAIVVGALLVPIAIDAGNPMILAFALAVMGAAGGFLPHNFPSARIFMGDVGSTFLGFTFGFVVILGSQDGRGRIPFVLSAILLAAPLLDAAVTVVRRALRGEHWLLPHRDFYFQRLVSHGFTPRSVTLGYFCFNLMLGFMAYLYVTGVRPVFWSLVALLFVGAIVAIAIEVMNPPAAED